MSPGPTTEPSVAVLRDGYASGRLTVAGVMEEYLARIGPAHGRPDPWCAVVCSDPSGAMARARELDELQRRSGRLAGPLHGIPVLVKDTIETADLPTAYGVRSLRHHRPTRDARVVSEIRRAGGVVVGKTATPDLAMSLLSWSSANGLTPNAYDPDVDSGGSSAGSAVGVAADLAVVAIGTDTSGSVRVPSAFAQAVALRPTGGLLSSRGVSSLVRWQDTPGPIARSVPDLAALLDAMISSPGCGARRTGYADGLRGASLAGCRIGLLDLSPWPELDDDGVGQVIARAVDELRLGGAVVEPVALPDLRDLLRDGALFATHARADIDAFLRSRKGIRYDSLAAMAQAGEPVTQGELAQVVLSGPNDPAHDPGAVRRQQARRRLIGRLAAALSGGRFDALAHPTSLVPPPAGVDVAAGRASSAPYAALARIAAQADLPAVTVPAGCSAAGVPVGLELLGRPFDEMRLLRLAAAYEQATRHRRRPGPDRAGKALVLNAVR